MKSFSMKINQCFKKEKNFMKYCMSLLANSGNLNDIFETCRHMFVLLLCKSRSECHASKQFLEMKMSDIESFKQDSLKNNSFDSFENIAEEKQDNSDTGQLPLKEETYLQQSKRSLYYKKCKNIFDEVQTGIQKKQELQNFDSEDVNALYSPAYAEYFLNNWCGLLPFWTSLHLGDQGRHGCTDVYVRWSNKFSSCDCVRDPPKTQGIVEFHQKSVKHITMNSKRQRLDDVVANLFIFKKSKLRQLEISKSRKKVSEVEKDKVKDSVSSKIVTEKWRKKKQHKGPGYFQKNRKLDSGKRQQEEWEKLPIIPWGGSYYLASGQKITLYHTCTIDNFLQVLLVFYSLNINQMQRLFTSRDPLVRKVSEVLQLLLTNDFEAAKFCWLTEICNLSPNPKGNILNAFGTDKQLIMYPIRAMFLRTYEYSSCSSEKCPLNSFDVKHDNFSDMTLHLPDVETEDAGMIEQSIREWELGISTKAMISCKGEYAKEPDHRDYISENDKNRTIIRCSGWRTPLHIKFVTKPPFLVFDISAVFRDQIKDLSYIPYDIYAYDDKYRFGGASSYVQHRSHYVGYICLSNNDILFYDGLPSRNPILQKYPHKNIQGDISLLFYFPYDHSDNIDKNVNSDMVDSCNNIQDMNDVHNDKIIIKISTSVAKETQEIDKLKSSTTCQERKRTFGLRKNPKKKDFF